MNDPSIVSSSDMPAANSTGRHMIAYTGRPLEAAPAARNSSATSVAVSNPRPNSMPKGYMCQDALTRADTGPRILLMKPREPSSRSSSAWSSSRPARTRAQAFAIPTRTTMLIAAIRYRNAPEMLVPTTPVSWWSTDPEWLTCEPSARRPSASASASANTIVECPSEKKKPTPSGR